MNLDPTPFDIVIRNGTIIDGLGGPQMIGDVAVRCGRIEQVGHVPGKGREEIDATGLLNTPGFVDIHTHYDAHAIWEARMQPSRNMASRRPSSAIAASASHPAVKQTVQA